MRLIISSKTSSWVKAVTDAAGKFLFSKLPVGDYTIEVEGEEVRDQRDEQSLNREQPLNEDTNLVANANAATDLHHYSPNSDSSSHTSEQDSIYFLRIEAEPSQTANASTRAPVKRQIRWRRGHAR